MGLDWFGWVNPHLKLIVFILPRRKTVFVTADQQVTKALASSETGAESMCATVKPKLLDPAGRHESCWP